MIPLDKLKECYNKGISLELIWLLQYIENGGDVDEISNDIPKFEGVKLSLLRKSYITDDYKLTVSGKELIKFLNSVEEGKLVVKKKPKEDTFLQWWFEYPSTDTFEYRGKKFAGSRALRVKKNECEAKVNKILNEGEFTISDLIGALKLEIQQKKDASIKSNLNKLSYFQNSLTYLNQATYAAYVDLIRSGHKIEEKSITTSNETYI